MIIFHATQGMSLIPSLSSCCYLEDISEEHECTELGVVARSTERKESASEAQVGSPGDGQRADSGANRPVQQWCVLCLEG